MLDVTFFTDQDFSCAGFTLKPGGEIDHVADGCVIFVVFGTEPADAGITGGDADGDFQREPEAIAQAFKGRAQLTGRQNGATSVIVMPNRHVEQSHYGVADVLVDEGAVFHQGFGGHSQKSIDDFMGSFRAEIVGQFRKG